MELEALTGGDPHGFVAILAGEFIHGQIELRGNESARIAQKYVRHRLFVVGIALPLLGIGAALAISGYVWAGLPLVAAGFLLPRVIKSQAPKILLYLAQHDAKTYFEAMKFGILEVRHR